MRCGRHRELFCRKKRKGDEESLVLHATQCMEFFFSLNFYLGWFSWKVYIHLNGCLIYVIGCYIYCHMAAQPNGLPEAVALMSAPEDTASICFGAVKRRNEIPPRGHFISPRKGLQISLTLYETLITITAMWKTILGRFWKVIYFRAEAGETTMTIKDD